MPQKSESPVSVEQIDGMIRTIRGVRVMLDRDLAKIYGVPTFRFNEAIKRNRHRFPTDFMFQLTRAEFDSLTSQIAMSKPENSSQNAMSKTGRGGRRTVPYAFTEHGALQAANVLRSPRAVQMSVFVIRAFVKMREALRGTPSLRGSWLHLRKSSLPGWTSMKLRSCKSCRRSCRSSIRHHLHPNRHSAELLFNNPKSRTTDRSRRLVSP